MRGSSQRVVIAVALAGGVATAAAFAPTEAQTARRDGIGELLKRDGGAQVAQAQPGAQDTTKDKAADATPTADPREGDPATATWKDEAWRYGL